MIPLLKFIKTYLKDTMEVWAAETKLILKDTGILLFIIIVPLGYPLIYTLCYNPEIVQEVPVTVVDQSHSSESREYIRKLDATAQLDIISLSANQEDALQQIKEHKSYGYIVIPSDFAKNLNTLKQAHISAYCDMSGMLNYQAILTANTNVSLDINKSIQTKLAGNTTQRQDEITTAPITYEDVDLYNSSAGMASYLIPAVLILIIQQTLLLGIGMAAGTRYEERRYHERWKNNNRTGGTIRVLLGVMLAYLVIEIFNTAYLTLAVPAMFNLNQIMQIGTVIVFMLPYIIACIFFAITCATWVRNREATMLIFVFTSVPLLFISGISWPGAAVPAFWKGVSYIFPSTFGINGYVRINAEGATISDVSHEYIFLWIQAIFYFTTAYLSVSLTNLPNLLRKRIKVCEPQQQTP